MKLIITMCLGVVLVLLIAAPIIKGRQQLLDGVAPHGATVSLSTDLRQALQESLGNGAARALPGRETAAHPPAPLPRDPFASRVLAVPQILQPPPPAEAEQTPQPSLQPAPETLLRLKATALDRYGALVLINDQVLTVGQTILDYTVVHIAAGQVELVGNGHRLWLKLENSDSL